MKPTKTAIKFQSTHIDDIYEQAHVIRDGYPLPLEIELSLVDACTRRCPGFCPRGNERIAPNTGLRMTRYLYTKLANDLKEIGYKGLVMFSGYGEPMLHKDLPEIVKEFSFTYVDMNTNGDLLTRGKLEALIDAGINHVLISVYDKEKEELFKEMVKGFEGKTTLRPRYGNMEGFFANRAGACYEKHIDKICYYPYYFAMVDSNGDVFPCCHEWHRKLKMGNLYQSKFWEIWTSGYYARVRKIINEGKRDIFPCRICDVDGTYRGGRNYELYNKLPTFR